MVAIAVQPPNSLPQSAIGNQKSAIDRGWIDTFYRTYKGKRLGPYYVRKWRVGRKIKREYIKAKDLESVKAQCEENKRRRLDRIQAGKNENRFIDNFKFLWTMIERQDRNKPITPEQAAHIVKIHRESCYAYGRPRLRKPKRPPYEMIREALLRASEKAFRDVMNSFFRPKPSFYGCMN